MYGKSVIRELGVAFVLVVSLSGLLAAEQQAAPARLHQSSDTEQQFPVPMLPEIVVTATRLEA